MPERGNYLKNTKIGMINLLVSSILFDFKINNHFYFNRFNKTGDVMNKGQMYSPKVVFTRNFSTPKIQDEKRFEPIFYSNDKTMTHSYEVQSTI